MGGTGVSPEKHVPVGRCLNTRGRAIGRGVVLKAI